MHRFGEAFRGELSNLQAATLFGSWQLREDYDASLVYHKFWRVDDDSDIGTSGINAALQPGEKDIGQELDLVVTKYFKQGLLPASMSQYVDEPSALIRFRGGLFAGRRLRAGHRLDHAPRLRRLHLALLSPARKPDMPDISLSIPAAGSRACARWPRQCSARCCCTARRGRRSRWRNRSRSRRRPATSRA